MGEPLLSDSTPARSPIPTETSTVVAHGPQRVVSSEARRAASAYARSAALYAAFALSGLAGLLYETIWTRYLGLLLGHSAYAQVVVLVIFLGGTAVGALYVGGRTAVRHPLLAYAIVEAAIGALGVAFPSVYRAVTAAMYGQLLPALGSDALVVLAQWTIAAALILPQSILLGTTFPLMSAAILRRAPAAPGRVLAQLYFMNGFGGAIGVLAGGFVLVGRFGLGGALVAAGLTSSAAALLAATIALLAGEHRMTRKLAVVPGDDVAPAVQTRRVPLDAESMLLLAVAFGTAVASLAYEIAWTRMLSLVLGGATHSFELMLSAFILGLSLGALWLRSRADRWRDPRRALGIVQWAMGALAIATLPLYLASFHWTVVMVAALDLTTQGYSLFSIGRYAVCLAIMLPATFCAGITLPLITKILVRTDTGESAVGIVYGANTLGSIVGVVLGAMVLLPMIGLKGLLVAAAALDMALGVWLFASRRDNPARLRVTVAAALAAVVVCALGVGVRFDRAVLTSGVFSSRPVDPPERRKILFYRDGRTATVSGTHLPSGAVVLATNGKPDASLDLAWMQPFSAEAPKRVLASDAATQTLLAVTGLAHAPDARTVAVVGQGSGMSSHIVLGSSTVESLTTLEIEPQMIVASNIFYPANRRVFDDPRSHIVIEDARAYFASHRQRFDLIVSEPSNPWVSGVSSLFTQEFYHIVSSRLGERGVLAQWIQLYETNDQLIVGILAAIHQNFRSYALYHTSNMDLVVIASNAPALRTPDWSVVQHPQIAADFRLLVPITPEALDALWVGDRATFAPLLDMGIAANSDYVPLLDLGADRERYMEHSAAGFATLGSHRFDPFAALTGHRMAIGTAPLTVFPGVARANAAALAARLRLGLDAGHDTLPRSAEYQPALLRLQMLRTFMAASAPPSDWQLWMRHVALIERDVHGMAAGAADEQFYGSLFAYLERAKAPGRAAAALHFMHGLAAWKFDEAAGATDVLISEALLGEGWVPADMLRDGAVVSRLMTKDVVGARTAFDKLTPLGGEGAELRSRLLEAHLARAERASRGAP